MKHLFLIFALQFVCVIAFSQEPISKPSQAKESEIFTLVDEQAAFPGGKPAMQKFIEDHLQYPQKAKEMGLQGKCYVQLTISEKGEIVETKIKKGVSDCPECDQEALRIIKLMPKWSPGKNSGVAVKSYFNIPVIFQLK